MGDTFRDPFDHVRTTRPHAGESLADTLTWPAYLFIAAGMVATVGCLAAFGTGYAARGLLAAAVAVVATALGLVWRILEHRRVVRIEDRWHQAHPDLPRAPPTS